MLRVISKQKKVATDATENLRSREIPASILEGGGGAPWSVLGAKARIDHGFFGGISNRNGGG